MTFYQAQLWLLGQEDLCPYREAVKRERAAFSRNSVSCCKLFTCHAFYGMFIRKDNKLIIWQHAIYGGSQLLGVCSGLEAFASLYNNQWETGRWWLEGGPMEISNWIKENGKLS